MTLRSAISVAAVVPAVALVAAALLAAQDQPRSEGAQPVDVAARFRSSGAIQRLDTFVARQMRQDRTPGLALAIASREGTVMVGTYGFADLRARVPLTPAHQFEIGSISKSFTALALLRQMENGRFDPQQPIRTYLPWFRVKASPAPITGHHLLTHTAGIPRDRDDVPSSMFQAAALAEREVVIEPGTRYWYSNVGYQVLGYVLAAVSGKPYADAIRDSILRPLGMNASDAQITHDTRLRLAVGYGPLYDDRPAHRNHPLVPANWLEYGAGDGGVVSTPGDMAIYLRMLLNRGAGPEVRIVAPSSFDLFARKAAAGPEGRAYGYGIQIVEAEGRTILAHSGGMVGYSAMLAADLTDGLGAIVMINGPGDASATVRYALELARAAAAGSPLPELPPLEDPADTPEAEQYAGIFSSTDGRKIQFVAESSRLWLEDSGTRYPMERRGKDRFYAAHPDFALFLFQFVRDAAGNVAEVVHGGDWFAGARYNGPTAFEVPEDWRAFPGHYRASHPWLNNFRVVIRKGQLRLITPDGEDMELLRVADGEFAIGRKDSAERVVFDAVVDGSALRATLSGTAYYRTFTP